MSPYKSDYSIPSLICIRYAHFYVTHFLKYAIIYKSFLSITKEVRALPFKVRKLLVINSEHATKGDQIGLIFKDGTCIILGLDPTHTPTPGDPDYHMVVKKKPLHMKGETEELTEADKALLQRSVVRIRKADLIPKEPLQGRRRSLHDETSFETFMFADGSPLSGVYPV